MKLREKKMLKKIERKREFMSFEFLANKLLFVPFPISRLWLFSLFIFVARRCRNPNFS